MQRHLNPESPPAFGSGSLGFFLPPPRGGGCGCGPDAKPGNSPPWDKEAGADGSGQALTDVLCPLVVLGKPRVTCPSVGGLQGCIARPRPPRAALGRSDAQSRPRPHRPLTPKAPPAEAPPTSRQSGGSLGTPENRLETRGPAHPAQPPPTPPPNLRPMWSGPCIGHTHPPPRPRPRG